MSTLGSIRNDVRECGLLNAAKRLILNRNRTLKFPVLLVLLSQLSPSRMVPINYGSGQVLAFYGDRREMKGAGMESNKFVYVFGWCRNRRRCHVFDCGLPEWQID